MFGFEFCRFHAEEDKECYLSSICLSLVRAGIQVAGLRIGVIAISHHAD
jgi:hypothetical protein